MRIDSRSKNNTAPRATVPPLYLSASHFTSTPCWNPSNLQSESVESKLEVELLLKDRVKCTLIQYSHAHTVCTYSTWKRSMVAVIVTLSKLAAERSIPKESSMEVRQNCSCKKDSSWSSCKTSALSPITYIAIAFRGSVWSWHEKREENRNSLCM